MFGLTAAASVFAAPAFAAIPEPAPTTPTTPAPTTVVQAPPVEPATTTQSAANTATAAAAPVTATVTSASTQSTQAAASTVQQVAATTERAARDAGSTAAPVVRATTTPVRRAAAEVTRAAGEVTPDTVALPRPAATELRVPVSVVGSPTRRSNGTAAVATPERVSGGPSAPAAVVVALPTPRASDPAARDEMLRTDRPQADAFGDAWSALRDYPSFAGGPAHGSARMPEPARAPPLPVPTPPTLLGAIAGTSGAGSSVTFFAALTLFLLAITSLGRRFRPTPELLWSPAYVAVRDRPG